MPSSIQVTGLWRANAPYEPSISDVGKNAEEPNSATTARGKRLPMASGMAARNAKVAAKPPITIDINMA